MGKEIANDKTQQSTEMLALIVTGRCEKRLDKMRKNPKTPKPLVSKSEIYNLINFQILRMSIAQFLNESIQNTREVVLNVHTAPYDVVETFGDYEVRDYPVQNLVDTIDNGDAFNRLYSFITGTNDQKEEIPMTAPVYS